MFFSSQDLPKGLFKASIVPRPIAWISTSDKERNFNLAPFSYFNAVSDSPPMIMFSTTNAHIEGGPKDTLKNIEETGEFVVNIATFEMRSLINQSSADLSRSISEFEFAGVEYDLSKIIKAPLVKRSPINIECEYHSSVQLPSNSEELINRMVIGKVLGIHIKDDVMVKGLIDINLVQPIARLGYNDYAKIGEIFSMTRPSF